MALFRSEMTFPKNIQKAYTDRNKKNGRTKRMAGLRLFKQKQVIREKTFWRSIHSLG